MCVAEEFILPKEGLNAENFGEFRSADQAFIGGDYEVSLPDLFETYRIPHSLNVNGPPAVHWFFQLAVAPQCRNETKGERPARSTETRER